VITCYLENGDKVGLRHVTVSTIILKDKKILLERRGTFHGKPILESGKWALVGGFVDRNETLVEAAKREAREETGWEINNFRLFRIDDDPERLNDAERQNIGFIFITEAITQIPSKTEEVTELKWFGIDELPSPDKIAFDFSEDLDLYKKYLKEKFPLPVLG
jgi:ADP-ribose pyrophosphatase YjhB (NUDIX family)